MRDVSVSVLIPQYGRTELTARAVQAVRRSDHPGEVEILVYDNGSPEGPGPVADRDDVVVVRSAENTGFGPAINALAGRAGGDLLLILNNDTVVDPSALRLMVERHLTQDDVGAVSPQYRDFSGQVLEMGGVVGRAGRARQLFHHEVPPRSLTRMPFPVHYGSAACLLVSRDRFLSMGGFDDAYAPAYYEDTDLCLRLRQDGLRTVVEPRAVVYHHEGATGGRDVHQGLKSYQLVNRRTFADRWEEQLNAFGEIDEGALIREMTEPPDGRLRILWLAPTLPRPDRDGGGRRIVSMLETLREMDHQVVVWGRAVHDPDRYGTLLGSLGIPWFGGSHPARWSGGNRELSRFDVLRELLRAAPWDVVVTSFARLARRVTDVIREEAPAAASLVDNGDLHFLRHDRARALGIEITDDLDKDSELDAYARSDGVITSSAPEDRVLRAELPGLPTYVFAVAAPEPVPPDATADGERVMFLGNFGHPPNVDAVEWWLDDIAGELAELVQRQVTLRLVGAGTDSAGRDLEGAQGLLDVAGWVPDLSTEFRRTRVFLAPLRYGAGTKGKILDALSFGVPTVTTSIGAEGYPRYVKDALLIADDAAGLAAYTARLLSDDAEWRGWRERVRAAAERAWNDQQEAAGGLSTWMGQRAGTRRSGEQPVGRGPSVWDLPPDPHYGRETGAGEETPTPVASEERQPAAPRERIEVCEEPIFVVGAPRSGTSMMQWSLRQHPALWGGEESDFMIPLIDAARPVHRFGWKRGDLHWLSAEHVGWEEFLRYIGYGINALYTQRAGGLRWVEQTPQYTLHLDDLSTMFPGSRFVFMLRDGRQVVHSLRHFVRPIEHERACVIWRNFTEAGLGFKDGPQGDRLHIVRYDRIVADTEAVVRGIYDFLEMDFEPASVAFIADKSPINSSFVGEAAQAKVAPRWMSWTPGQREVFDDVAGDLLVELGFEPDHSWVQQDVAP